VIRYLVLRSADEKRTWQGEVTSFFERVFGRPLPAPDYQHFVVRSPYEEGYCLLALDGERVVGTANLIPQRLASGGDRVPYLLFTTSAVDPAHRRQGIYLDLMRLLIEEARGAGQRFILAFPNQMALLPLTRLGGFKLIRSHAIVQGRLERLGALRPVERERSVALDERFLRWRLEHRAYFAARRGELTLICKRHLDATDVVEVLGPDPGAAVEALPQGELGEGDVNLLDSRCTAPEGGEPSVRLHVTWRPLSEDVGVSAIDVSLLMWDIV
jgi:GNAT superfamily N-acetyltransferase